MVTTNMRPPLTARPEPAKFESSNEPTEVATKRVLVVDDNADAAGSLAMLLELDGHQTRVAHHGAGALAAVAEFEPDVVFLDIGLPDISGYEVARRLRESMSAPGRPRLIALTGWGADEDRRQAKAAGFDAHLVKPVEPEQLRAMLS
jgi:CheY-like chemotaxis protein